MSHSYSTKRTRLYRYYVCHRAQKQGWKKCPSPSIPAGEIERFVIDEIKAILIDSELAALKIETIDEAEAAKALAEFG
jgi:site-specific DNA recombinase